MDKTLGLCRSTEDCGKGISMLALRLFAAYEFGEAGLAKWRGENWFADIRDAFPFPFDLLPAGLSWNLAMGAELVVPVLLVLGLLTRLGAHQSQCTGQGGQRRSGFHMFTPEC